VSATLKTGQKLKHNGPEGDDDDRARYNFVESRLASSRAENTPVKEERAGFCAAKT
jgi:hypothetical protein